MLSITTIRQQALLIFTLFFWACVPAAFATGLLSGIGSATPPLLAAAVALIATLAWKGGMARPAVEYLFAMLAMVQVSVLVASAQNGWQIDFHMVYFAVLAMLTAFCNWRVILLGAGVTAVHHLSFSFLLPSLVFGTESGSLGRVLFHALVVVMETGVLSWLAYGLERSFAASDSATQRAEAAAAETERLRHAQLAAENALRAERTAVQKSLADRFAADVETITRRLDAAVRGLRDEAQILGNQVADTQSATRSARGEAVDAISHTAAVAAAVEQMAASITDVTRTIHQTATQVRETVQEVRLVEGQVADLSGVAERIGGVVQLIADIAGQTNLLALNATIEAARAGEAGKGFAIVASEVKGLANQTARATEDISRQIGEIQSATQAAVAAISTVARSIGAVDGNTAEIAAAMQQQQATVGEISRSIQTVSGRATTLGQLVGNMADMASSVAGAIGKTTATAGDAERMSGEMNRRLGAFIHDLRQAS
ncbi:methyl-accepting chemotaxis protein [Niveispirillum sp. BGYR6]|uniref:methyl-accepting chemotaxis protein n=1 Tax=Niveispirillum sp. BGYR6 TaxID=2971249 RepID=UPI0022B995C5|nr:methyl-accepting chemotaxis protein [Niveispirillum sp. BGYR6]MDG5495845.1 methyl-accepting chemotaxis protein [Niveispirillum sp. BGYR6]